MKNFIPQGCYIFVRNINAHLFYIHKIMVSPLYFVKHGTDIICICYKIEIFILFYLFIYFFQMKIAFIAFVLNFLFFFATVTPCPESDCS